MILVTSEENKPGRVMGQNPETSENGLFREGEGRLLGKGGDI